MSDPWAEAARSLIMRAPREDFPAFRLQIEARYDSGDWPADTWPVLRMLQKAARRAADDRIAYMYVGACLDVLAGIRPKTGGWGAPLNALAQQASARDQYDGADDEWRRQARDFLAALKEATDAA